MKAKIFLIAGILAAFGVAAAQGEAPYAPGELIVKFPEKAPAMGALSNQILGAQAVQTLGTPELQRVKLPPGTSMQSAIALYKAMGAEYAEPNYRMKAVRDPNDPYFSSQYGLARLKCPASWDITMGSDAVVIAIVDTGVDLDHPDLAAKLVPGTDFVNGDDVPDDDNGHGTHCAGIAAAATNNSLGVAGVAPNCKIMPVKVLDASGNGYLSTVAQGIRYAADGGAKVISLSLGSTAASQTLQQAVNYALSKGALVVAAAGNEGTTVRFYPAACNGVVSVAASDSSDARAAFSNYGSWVSVAAPGVRILSTWPGDAYAYASGTSMATPFVAGAAAVLFSYFGPSTPPLTIKEKIEANCDPVGAWVANGRVNLLAALTGPDDGNGGQDPDALGPFSLSLTRGSVLRGDVGLLAQSDDQRLVIQSAGSPLRVIDGYASFNVGPASKIASASLSLEGLIDTPGAVGVYAYQFSRKRWVLIGTASFSSFERTFSGPLSLNWSQYVSSGGELRIRLYRTYRSANPMVLSLDAFQLSLTKNP